MSLVPGHDARRGHAEPSVATQPIGRRMRSSLWSTLSGLVMSIGSYLIISRLVSPSEYGRAAVILSLWGVCSTAIDWCGPLMMRFGPVELGQHGSLRVTLSTRLVFSLPLLVLLLPGAPLYFALSQHWPPMLLFSTVAWLLAATTLGVAQWSAVAAQRFRQLTIANTVARATTPIAIVALYAAGRLGVRSPAVPAEALVMASLVGIALGAVILVGALRPLLGLTRPDRTLLGAMWRYSLPSLVAAPSLAAMTYADPLILERSVSHAEVGHYQLAYVTITIFGALGAGLNNVLSPELVAARARDDAHVIDRYRSSHQGQLALALGLFTIGGACVAAPIARLLLPSTYAASADVAAILCVAGGLMAGVWSYHPLVTVTDSVWALQIASMLSAFTNVALDLLLAPSFGITGVALANVAAWAIQFIVLALLLHRRIGARRFAVVPLLVAAAVVLLLLVGRAPSLLRTATGLFTMTMSSWMAWRFYQKRRI